ncbi:MAG: hypothetical protein ACKN85_13135, partial [Pirellula sp.]
MFKRDRKPSRRLFRFERLELRAMLASDVVWNNVNWDPIAGNQNPVKSAADYYTAGNSYIGLNLSPNKLVIGLNQSSVQLPDSLQGDYGLGGRARVYESR